MTVFQTSEQTGAHDMCTPPDYLCEDEVEPRECANCGCIHDERECPECGCKDVEE